MATSIIPRAPHANKPWGKELGVLATSPENGNFAPGAASLVTGLGLNMTSVNDWGRVRGREQVQAVLRSTSTSGSFSSLGKLSMHRDDVLLRRSMAACQNSQELVPTETLPTEAVRHVNDFLDIPAFELEQKVRDYQIDRYGLVHLAVYAQYCQHARHELLSDVGFSADAVAKSGNSLAMSETTTTILSPLRSGDRFLLRVVVRRTTAARILVDSFVYRLPEKELVVKATGIAVYLNKDYKPTRIPDDLRCKLLRYTTPSNPEASSVSVD